MTMLFDSHAHYDDEKFDNIREEILSGITSGDNICPCGVGYIVNAGCDIQSSRFSVALSEKYGFMYAAVGIHPHEAQNADEKWFEEIESMLSHPKVCAIGEAGLDFHYDFSPREIQKKVFERQMLMSQKTGYPIIVHDREAHGQTMEVVSQYKTVGVMHSFSGSCEMAKELIKKGWYVSYSGSVTFKNAVNLAETVQYVPDDKLLIETDAPYLAPVPYRGQLNTSKHAYATAQKIADLKHKDVEYILEITQSNAKKLFNIQ